MTGEALRISPLGGVGEVGKNSTLVELGEDMIIVDAGVKFPETELHGVNLVVCDYTYVAERLDRLLGIVFTHGHEDHIGGLPYLIMQIDPHDPIPIYGTPLTLGLISVKLKEHGMLGRVIQIAIREGQRARLGPFDVEPVAVNHSIPDAVGLVIRTPAGVLFHTGDFKFDPTPVQGRTTDNARLRQLGDEGVLVLLSDCVRVEQPGWTASEAGVREALEQLIGAAPGRVLVTTFASNIGRLCEVVRSAHKLGRKTGVVGRSMEENLRVARELGFLQIPDGSLVELRELAVESGIPRQNVFLTEIGNVVAFSAEGAQREEAIQSGSVLVDGLTIGEVTNVVLRDRRRLAADGVLFVSVTLDRETGELLSGPDFVSRGFLQADRDEDGLYDEARERVESALSGGDSQKPDVAYLVGKVRDTLNSFVYERTRRRPMILPVVTEV